MPKKAFLVLNDGTVYEGLSAGAHGTAEGEVVFSTGMTGYQEMLTDPSFRGQILTFTYPLLGNYGVNDEDVESLFVQVRGVVMKELCEKPSNWRSKKSLGEYLKENNIVGLQGIDTRALTRHLRVHGVMMGMLSTEESPKELLKKISGIRNYGETDFVKEVSAKESYTWSNSNVPTWSLPKITEQKDAEKTRVVLVDYGVKLNILRLLTAFHFHVTVVPCTATADEILSHKPHGVVFSPGPGDPEKLDYAVENAKELISARASKNKNGKLPPIFGICLGHQVLARALGGKTFKLKFGHRGANHPVKDLRTGKVHITSQNHGYAVDGGSLKNSGVKITHLHLNDGTVEGMENDELSIYSIQYHPEASPGPRDNVYMFEKFLKRVRGEV